MHLWLSDRANQGRSQMVSSVLEKIIKASRSEETFTITKTKLVKPPAQPARYPEALSTSAISPFPVTATTLCIQQIMEIVLDHAFVASVFIETFFFNLEM